MDNFFTWEYSNLYAASHIIFIQVWFKTIIKNTAGIVLHFLQQGNEYRRNLCL